ncbi:PREDICTED: lysosomal Pro-X carboxypeptidase, partial [Rhagoletis zephyria]|uniref:lysosomal Pro-X carboxypeptidase n=1 Tax=Rhagoletis zephyria TaxID=28612 RepID=UPI000811AAA9
CNQYYDIITKDFTNYSPLCSSSIRNSWKAVRHVAETEEGRAWLTALFQLCKPLKRETVDDFVAFILGAWDSMSMTDYPAPANFLNPMPAYPIKHACKFLTTPNADERTLIKTIYQGRFILELLHHQSVDLMFSHSSTASSIFYNYTGQTKCNDIESTGGGLGDIAGWNFQACTEMVLPVCSNGVTDMFEPNPWNITSYSLNCYKQFGVYSDVEKALILFGGDHIKSASNIIFSNGDRDPWSAGGVLHTLNPTLPAIKIPGACHHEDLRPSTPSDPQTLKDVRVQELKIIKGWLDAYYTEKNIVIPF